MEKSMHHTICKVDEKLTLHSGDVVRMNNWDEFSDNIILGFDEGDNTAYAKVARPYAYVSGAGTTGPVALLGMEQYTLPVLHIRDHFKIVSNDGHRARVV